MAIEEPEKPFDIPVASLAAEVMDKPKFQTIGQFYAAVKERFKKGGDDLFAASDPGKQVTDFFGADEAITNYAVDRTDWVATLIVNAADRSEAWQKRNCVIENIMAHYPVKHYLDLKPA